MCPTARDNRRGKCACESREENAHVIRSRFDQETRTRKEERQGGETHVVIHTDVVAEQSHKQICVRIRRCVSAIDQVGKELRIFA